MGLPLANDIPHGSKDSTLSHSGPHKPCGLYGLKLLVPNLNFLMSSTLASTSIRLPTTYIPVHIGSVGHGAFFFLYNPAENPIKMWYAISYMTNLSVENIGNTCGAFSTLYILIKVSLSEAYLSTMFSNASIAA